MTAAIYDAAEGRPPQARERDQLARLNAMIARMQAGQPLWAGRLAGVGPLEIAGRAGGAAGAAQE